MDSIDRRAFKEKVQANKEKFKRNLKLAEKNSKWLKRKKNPYSKCPCPHPILWSHGRKRAHVWTKDAEQQWSSYLRSKAINLGRKCCGDCSNGEQEIRAVNLSLPSTLLKAWK